MNHLPILNYPAPDVINIDGITYSVTAPDTQGDGIIVGTVGTRGGVVHVHRKDTQAIVVAGVDTAAITKHVMNISLNHTSPADANRIRRHVHAETFKSTARLLGVDDWRLLADSMRYNRLHDWITDSIRAALGRKA